MLVISRRVGEQIRIGSGIVVTLLKLERNKARLGIEAPRDVQVLRQELFDFAHEGARRIGGRAAMLEARAAAKSHRTLLRTVPG